jgi:hypothetical protein
MLINEFTQLPDMENADLLDDLHFFMHNDPNFYRKVFYPMIAKVRDHVKSGKQCKDTVFKKCVNDAVDIYCKKFNLAGNPTSVFTNVDRDELARKIFGQEIDQIHKGTYDNTIK